MGKGQQGKDKKWQLQEKEAHLRGTQDELVHKFSLTRLQLLQSRAVSLLILSEYPVIAKHSHQLSS